MDLITRNNKWWYESLPLGSIVLLPMILQLPSLWVSLWVPAVGFPSIQCVFKANVARTVKASQSCFFMPCAPQSINEENQLFALFAGLLIFLGWEVLPMIVKEFKKRCRDRKEFLRLMEERMQQV